MTSLGFKNDQGLGIIHSIGIHLKIMLKVFKKPLSLIMKKNGIEHRNEFKAI